MDEPANAKAEGSSEPEVVPAALQVPNALGATNADLILRAANLIFPTLGLFLHHPREWGKAVRGENTAAIFGRAFEVLDERGVDPKKLTPIEARDALPLLEAVSMESDPDLRKMWANLIANAADPSSRAKPSRRLILILSSFDPLDALVLRFVGGQGWAGVPGPHQGRITVEQGGITAETVAQALKVSVSEVQRSVDGLIGQGCVMYAPPPTNRADPTTVTSAEIGRPLTQVVGWAPRFIRATSLGLALLAVCDVNPTK